MPVFQFKCENCSSIFEHLVFLKHPIDVTCITCGGDKISRIENTFFSPNKLFCPRESKSGGCGKHRGLLNI